MPFLISAHDDDGGRRAAQRMVEEVRRQFREIPGCWRAPAKPDSARCVEISTKAALREMIAPGPDGRVVPVVVGALGVEALGGLLAGATVTGVMMALFMANAGGAWDNAKKYIEGGAHGGKGSDPHKAAVVGDTVGDPFKDTSGPGDEHPDQADERRLAGAGTLVRRTAPLAAAVPVCLLAGEAGRERRHPPAHREAPLVLLALELDREQLDALRQGCRREWDAGDHVLAVGLVADVQGPAALVVLRGRQDVAALGNGDTAEGEIRCAGERRRQRQRPCATARPASRGSARRGLAGWGGRNRSRRPCPPRSPSPRHAVRRARRRGERPGPIGTTKEVLDASCFADLLRNKPQPILGGGRGRGKARRWRCEADQEARQARNAMQELQPGGCNGKWNADPPRAEGEEGAHRG